MSDKLNFEKALDTTAGHGGDFILPILADTVIPFIRMRSYLRQALKSFDMPTETYKLPKIPTGADVYFAGTNATAPVADIGTGTVDLVAKKLMVQLPIPRELSEDAIQPILSLIKDELARTFALAEEDCFLNGNASSPSPFWAPSDKRRAFDGLTALATGTPVDAAGSKITLAHLSTAIENMGKYGIDKDELFFVFSLREENYLRQLLGVNLALNQLGLTGTALPREIGKIWGIPVIATTQLNAGAAGSGDATEALLVNKSAAVIGDRRVFEIRSGGEVLMANDQILVVASERLAFAATYEDAIVKISNLGTNV